MSVQAGVAGLLKGSQVARFALPAPTTSTASSSEEPAPAVSASTLSPGHHAAPHASQPPPHKTPEGLTPPFPASSSPPSLVSASGQQSQDSHTAGTASGSLAQIGAADSRLQASTSASGSLAPLVEGPPSSQQAPSEVQAPASQFADQAVPVRSASSPLQSQQQQSPASTTAGDEATAEAVEEGSSVVASESKKAAGSTKRRSTSREDQAVPAEADTSPATAESLHTGSQPQLEAAGAQPVSTSGWSDEATAGSAETTMQQPGESSASEAGHASGGQRQGPMDRGALDRGHTSTDAVTPSTLTDTEAELDDSSVAGDKPQGEPEADSTDAAMVDSQGPTPLDVPPADAFPAARSASGLAPIDEAGLNESQHAQQEALQQAGTEQAVGKLLQGSAQGFGSNPVLLSDDAHLQQQQQQQPPLPPARPVASVTKDTSSSSRQDGSDASEGPLAGGVASEPAASQQQTQVPSSRATLPSTAGGHMTGTSEARGSSQQHRHQAAAAAGAVDAAKPAGSQREGTCREVPAAANGSRVAKVSSNEAAAEASSTQAVPSSAAAGDANRYLNESQQEKEPEARVLSPKGSSKSRQNLEMKRQQTSFNPLG